MVGLAKANCIPRLTIVEYTTHAMEILLLVWIFVGYALALCHLCSSFFLQSAVTQPLVLVLIVTINMTWKVPMCGFQNVGFGMALCMDALVHICYSISCPLCALNICDTVTVACSYVAHLLSWQTPSTSGQIAVACSFLLNAREFFSGAIVSVVCSKLCMLCYCICWPKIGDRW